MPSSLSAVIGWSLVLTGFLAAAWLDPWSFDVRRAAGGADEEFQRMLRHSHAAVLRMAFLQLALARLFQEGWFPHRTQQIAAVLTGVGVLLYAGGHLFQAAGSTLAWLMPAGALLNLTGLAVLAVSSSRLDSGLQITAILVVGCLGMLLDIAMGLFVIDPQSFHPEFLGAYDALPMRMLRLSQVAVIALAVLALLYFDTSTRPQSRRIQLGQWAMTAGAVAMPLLLCAAAFTSPVLKHLLSVPSWAVVAGAGTALTMSVREGRRLDAWAWSLIVASLLLGLIMGTYAFDGPLPTPDFIGAYADPVRRLMRLGHAYAIVLGMLTLFVAQTVARRGGAHALRGAAILLLNVASISLLAALVGVATDVVPSVTLAAGPVLVIIATLFCLGTEATQKT